MRSYYFEITKNINKNLKTSQNNSDKKKRNGSVLRHVETDSSLCSTRLNRCVKIKQLFSIFEAVDGP